MSRPQHFLEFLSTDEVERIHSTALRVLEEVGVEFANREILELLSDAGAQVDFRTQIARFPTYLVEAGIRQFPSRFTWYARDPARSIDMNTRDSYFGAPVAMIHVIEADGRRRSATQQDGEELTRLCDALPHLDIAGTGVDPEGLSLLQLEAWLAKTTYIHSTKPLYARPTNARAILPMAEVVADCAGLARDQLPLTIGINTYSPLHNNPQQLAGLIEYVRRGVPVQITPEVQAGASGPVTLAGVLVQAVAEFLSHAVVCQLIRPGVPVWFGCVSSGFDLRKLMLPYGSPEADLLGIATAQLGRHYGVPTRGTGGCADANALDMQAGYESLMSNLLCLMAGITYIQHAAGELENALALSYEKLLVDDEAIGMVRRLMQGIQVTPDTLALDAIRATGVRGSFLAAPHTAEHYRAEQFIPTLADRDKYEVWEAAGGKRIEERARDRLADLRYRHEPTPLPEAAVRELEAIYAAEAATGRRL